jgi:hypothetical protein
LSLASGLVGTALTAAVLIYTAGLWEAVSARTSISRSPADAPQTAAAGARRTLSEMPDSSTGEASADRAPGTATATNSAAGSPDVLVAPLDAPSSGQSATPQPCYSACNFGSDAILVVSGLTGTGDTGLEEVEVSSAVHLALHELELGDLTFRLTIRPRRCDGGADGGLVFDDTIGE